jgi:hypothetical protein
MVLLDPSWNIQSLCDHAGGTVHGALLRIPTRISMANLMNLQPSIEHALICIVASIAGDDAAQYVNGFLHVYAPMFSIPRLPGYD